MRIWKYLLLILCGGCNNGLPPIEYAAYIEDPDNGLFQFDTINDNVIQIQFLPSEYLALKEFSTIGIKKSEFKRVLSQYVESNYYLITIENKTISNVQERNDDELMYLNFDIQEDFMLISGKDSLDCKLLHRENIGKSRSDKFILAFDKPKCVTCDHTLFYSGNHSKKPFTITIPKERIKSIPSINI